jgi:hypothetical protein
MKLGDSPEGTEKELEDDRRFVEKNLHKVCVLGSSTGFGVVRGSARICLLCRPFH